MTQVNPALFSAMNLKSELEAGQGANACEGAQYLSRVLKKPALEKPTEIWRTYLRRYDSHSDVTHFVCEKTSQQPYSIPGKWKTPEV